MNPRALALVLLLSLPSAHALASSPLVDACKAGAVDAVSEGTKAKVGQDHEILRKKALMEALQRSVQELDQKIDAAQKGLDDIRRKHEEIAANLRGCLSEHPSDIDQRQCRAHAKIFNSSMDWVEAALKENRSIDVEARGWVSDGTAAAHYAELAAQVAQAEREHGEIETDRANCHDLSQFIDGGTGSPRSVSNGTLPSKSEAVGAVQVPAVRDFSVTAPAANPKE